MSRPMPSTCRCAVSRSTAWCTFRFLLSHTFGKLGLGHAHARRARSRARFVNRFRRRSRFRANLAAGYANLGVRTPASALEAAIGSRLRGRRRRYLSWRRHKGECLSRDIPGRRRFDAGEGKRRAANGLFPRFWVAPGSPLSDNARPLWTPQPAPPPAAPWRMPFARFPWMPSRPRIRDIPARRWAWPILPRCCGATSSSTTRAIRGGGIATASCCRTATARCCCIRCCT